MAASWFGPLNSGVAVGSAGVATANATSSHNIIGKILSVYVRYNDSPPAGTTDVTIEATAGNNPVAEPILTLSNAATDGTWHPLWALDDLTGGAGADPALGYIHIQDHVKVTIAQANAGDSVDIWLLMG